MFKPMMSGDDPDRLDQLWTVMQGEKGDLEDRSEEYARWTIPYLCPAEGTEGQEQEKADVAIGPRLVNHLANKIVDTMFPHERPFFTVTLTPDVRQKLRKEMGEEAEAQFAEAVRTETAMVEQVAMRKLRLTTYRPQAVEAVKHIITTGNAILKRLPDGRRVVYGVKDHCIRRKVDGSPYQILLRDMKIFGSLPADIKQRALNVHREYKDTDECTLYTEYKFDGSRWHMRQAVHDVLIDKAIKYRPVDLPVLPLVWNLARGENYGRGLVEDHTTAFHQVDVLTKALVDMAGIMAEIKFLIDPASTLDPVELNQSARGSYHQGRDGDISTPRIDRRMEIAALREMIADLQRELSQAFLLNSSTVRDAERVTAEEIRFIAMELESAFGGLYSRLALEWQQHEAEYAVSQINFDTDLGNSKLPAFEVVVTTGLESLSREGQLDNFRLAIADLQLLDNVPEEIRGAMNPQKVASFIFTNRAVPWKEFLYTPEELTANANAAMKREQDLASMQANAKVQEEAGKKAVQES